MKDEWVIEFRNGSFFVSPKADHGGSLDQAMRFGSEEEAENYADYNVPWVWFNGGMVCTVQSRLDVIARLPEGFR